MLRPLIPGEKSSRDEQVACAMLATQLDNFLGGDPIQHRHVQGFETPEFMELFPRGVSYKVSRPDSRRCWKQRRVWMPKTENASNFLPQHTCVVHNEILTALNCALLFKTSNNKL